MRHSEVRCMKARASRSNQIPKDYLLEQHPFHNYFFRVFDDVVVVALVVIVKSNIPTEKNRSAFDKGQARARAARVTKRIHLIS